MLKRLLHGMISRTHRIPRQDVLNVGDQQFLMLLFVMEPQLDKGRQADESIRRGFIDQPGHGFVDVLAIAVNLLDGGTRKPAACRPGVPLADGFRNRN